MITLTVLVIVWGVISTFRIQRVCKEQKIRFNPYKASIPDYLGFCIPLLYVMVCIVCCCIFYLP